MAGHRRFGYRGLHRLLRREGWEINPKRVYRVYREMGLQVRRRKRKRLKRVSRGPMPLPERRNEVWAMDFVHDALVDGRRIRAFTIVDFCTREAPWIEVAASIPGDRVVRVLEQLGEVHGFLLIYYGPESTSRAFDAWAYEMGVRLYFIQPGEEPGGGGRVIDFFPPGAQTPKRIAVDCKPGSVPARVAPSRRGSFL